MLRIAIISISIILGSHSEPMAQARGEGIYLSHFEPNATDRSRRNAYLLAYLSTLIYVEHLAEALDKPEDERETWQREWSCDRQSFLAAFEEHMRPLFQSPLAAMLQPLPPGLNILPGRNIVRGSPQPPILRREVPQVLFDIDPDIIAAFAESLRSGRAPEGSLVDRIPAARREPARFAYVTGRDTLLRDPEAIVISTYNTVFVAFRGTDRNCDTMLETSYNVAEWLTTDFHAVPIPPDVGGMRGKVHKGFWDGLRAPAVDFSAQPIGRSFREELARQIDAVMLRPDGSRKAIWLTGHSLGTSYARLFGTWLAEARDIGVNGIYVYAPPGIGDTDFGAYVEELFPGHRLQNFVFSADPITMLPPPGMPFLDWPLPGTLVQQLDVTDTRFDMPPRSGQYQAGVLALTAAAQLSTGKSPFCYHHPGWYLSAAFDDLSAADRLAMPLPVGVPDAGSEACTQQIVARAQDDAVNPPRVQTEFIMANKGGEVISEQSVRLRRATGNGRMSLDPDCFDSDGCVIRQRQVGAGDTLAQFALDHLPGAGYAIDFGSRRVEVDFWSMLSNGAKVQIWSENVLSEQAGTQRWYLIPLGSGRFNVMSAGVDGGALTADCAGAQTCNVTLRPLQANNDRQVWRLE